MTLILEFHFSSAHFYEQKTWTPKKNRDVFGKCYTPHGHGHNYRLLLEIDIGTVDTLTAKEELASCITPVISKLDHEHINFAIPWFKSRVPTTENISLYLKEQLHFSANYKPRKLTLFEMDSIYVELAL